MDINLIIKRTKNIYWETRLTKGCNIFLIIKSMCLELKIRCLKANASSIKHGLNQTLIISITSYPPRYKKLALTLKCLVNQSIAPDLIILWVTQEDYEILPENVTELAKLGYIEINITKDLGPGKKLIPALLQYPNAVIVTADDDIYYEKTWLGGLVSNWDGSANTVVAHRIHGVRLNAKGDIAPYLEWEFDKQTGASIENNFATGCGGVLFPPGCFYGEITDISKYLKFCHFQDDIWINWMVRMGESKIVKPSYKYSLVAWIGTNESGLFKNNSDYLSSGNDDCIIKMSGEYGVPYSKI